MHIRWKIRSRQLFKYTDTQTESEPVNGRAGRKGPKKEVGKRMKEVARKGIRDTEGARTVNRHRWMRRES